MRSRIKLDKDDVVAILMSDLHLTNKTPVARAEKDWLQVQANYLQQVYKLVVKYGCRLVIAGDVFDKPNPSPEVINFAMDAIPRAVTYAVPGQHDLLYHNYDLLKSAYGTLCIAGRIKNLDPGDSASSLRLNWHALGTPWGCSIPKPYNVMKGDKILAVVHKYIWTKGFSDYDAPESSSLVMFKKPLKGYSAAVFGDNHSGFIYPGPDCMIMNCGCFIRRRANERQYRPMVGILYADGLINPYHLDTSNDKWATPDEIIAKYEQSIDMRRFEEELRKLGDSELDFKTALQRASAQAVQQVVSIINRCMKGENK